MPTPPVPAADQAGRPPEAARAIRRRLLERVADADQRHRTVTASDDGWQPWLNGVQIKVLHAQGDSLSYLLRLAPGARLPPHRHPCDEECLVLSGWLQVGSQPAIGPGAYHLAPQGSLHPTISSPGGAMVFLRGAVPEAHHLLG
jgi:quercetin dioxygenase-like cupin family protein